MQTCKDIMTPMPAACRANVTIGRAARLMQDAGVGALPIIDVADGILVGILTDRDIVRRIVAVGLDPKTTQVSEVMTPDPVCCTASDGVETAARLMAEYQLRRLPVVDDRRELVGIIAQADVARKVDEPELVSEMVEAISQPAEEAPPSKSAPGPSSKQAVDPDSAAHPMQADR